MFDLRAHEGYLDQGIMVKDSQLLRAHYTKTRQMKVDILSIFPTDLLYLVFDNTCHEVRLGDDICVVINTHF